MEESIKCNNCCAELKGAYCQNCGEKAVSDNDFSVLSLIKLSFSTITNFDSKFFKTFRSLLFNPGHLANEFISGKRKTYMQPFQVFVLANLFFFFFLTNTDVFRNLSKWYFEEPGVKNKIESIVIEKNISRDYLAISYDNQSASLSKSAIAIIIPLMALMFLVLNFRKKYLFGKHLVFATHFLSFLMIFMVLLSFIFSIVPASGKYFNQVPILLAMIIYLGFSQKNFYKDRFWWATIKSILGTIMILFAILVYREVVSRISLYLVT